MFNAREGVGDVMMPSAPRQKFGTRVPKNVDVVHAGRGPRVRDPGGGASGRTKLDDIHDFELLKWSVKGKWHFDVEDLVKADNALAETRRRSS